MSTLGCCGGLAAGTDFEMWIEARLALGDVYISVVSQHREFNITEALRKAGFDATEVDGHGHDGPVEAIVTVAFSTWESSQRWLSRLERTQVGHQIDELANSHRIAEVAHRRQAAAASGGDGLCHDVGQRDDRAGQSARRHHCMLRPQNRTRVG